MLGQSVVRTVDEEGPSGQESVYLLNLGVRLRLSRYQATWWHPEYRSEAPSHHLVGTTKAV
jgi:hypothetical protein